MISEKILSRLQAECVRREHCTSDMRTKALKAVDGDEAAAEEILESLIADRFVDDGRYAAAFAREKASLSGWGPVKIHHALSAKGIDRETIGAALSEIDTDAASDKLESVLSAKLRVLREDPQRKLKLLRFALSRGYRYEQVAPVVDKLLSD